MNTHHPPDRASVVLHVFISLLGMTIIIFVLIADRIGVGTGTGFGPRQIVLALIGAAILSLGMGLLLKLGPFRRLERFLTTPKSASSSGHALFVGTCFGLIVGLLETGIVILPILVGKRLPGTSLDVLWITPLANVLIFSTVGIILRTLLRAWRRLDSMQLTVTAFSLLGLASLHLLFPRLRWYAALILAIGIAYQIGRTIAKHPVKFYQFGRFVLGWIGELTPIGIRHHNENHHETQERDTALSRRAFLLSTGATITSLTMAARLPKKVGESIALGELPDVASRHPNVLLIVLDTVRANNMSLFHYARPTTPNLEVLAKSGVVFDRAFSTSPWTLPSHASMFTGYYPHKLTADWLTPLDNSFPTLAEVLAARGYVTAGFVANTEYCSYATGLNRGFVHFEDYDISIGRFVASSVLSRTVSDSYRLRQTFGYYDLLGRKRAAKVNRNFLNWLSGTEHRPFFAFLNYFDAHNPYLPPRPFDTMFGSGTPRRYPAALPDRSWSEDEVQAELDAYDGAIAYLDHQIGLLLGELQRRNLMENTIVIVTSDHGEQFGEHDLFGHSNSLYVQNLHVPLLISSPGQVPSGMRVQQWVTLRDLPATVISLVDPQADLKFPGRTLARYWNQAFRATDHDPSTLFSVVNPGIRAPEWWPSTKGQMTSIVSDGYHYIKNGDGVEELYDLAYDPTEERDLAGDTATAQQLSTMRTALDELLPST